MDSLEKIDSSTEECDSLTDKLVLVVIKQTMVDIADLKMSLCTWNAQERHVYGDNKEGFKLGPITKEKADAYLSRYFNEQLKATKYLQVHQEDKDTEGTFSPSLTSFFDETQILPRALSKTGRMYKDCKNVMIPETRPFRCFAGSTQGRRTATSVSSSPTSTAMFSHERAIMCSRGFQETEKGNLFPVVSEKSLSEKGGHDEDSSNLMIPTTRSFSKCSTGSEVWWKRAHTPSSQTELSTPEMTNSCSQAFEETGSRSPAMSENGGTHNSVLATSELKGHEENSQKGMIPGTRPPCSCCTRSGRNIETITSLTITDTRLSWNTPSPLTTVIEVSSPEIAGSCSRAFEETRSLTSGLSGKEGIFMTLDRKSTSKCSTRSEVSGNTPSSLPTEMEGSCQTGNLFQALAKKRGHEVSKNRITPIQRSSSKCSTRSELRGKTASPAYSSSPVGLSKPEMEKTYKETHSLSPASLTSSAALTEATHRDPSYFKELEKQGDHRSQVRSSPAVSLPTITSDSRVQDFEEHRSLAQVSLEIKGIHSLSPALSDKEGHGGDSKNIVYPEVRSSYSCFARLETESKTAFSTTTRAISTLKSSSSCSTRSEVKGNTVPSASSSPTRRTMSIHVVAKSLSPALLEKVGHCEDSDNVLIQEKRLAAKSSIRSGVSRNSPSPCPTVIVAGSIPEMAEVEVFDEASCSLATSKKGGHDKDRENVPETSSPNNCPTRSKVGKKMPNPKMEDSCSQASKSYKEGHGMVPVPMKPSSTKLGSRKTAPTLPMTATLTEATLRSKYPGAVDEDLRWFTYRLAHYFIMLEKEGYRDRKNMIFEMRPSSICSTGSNRKTGSPATATVEITETTLGRSNTYECQKQENKQNESVWRKFFGTWRKNKIHPLSPEDQKEDFTSSPPCTTGDPCQPKNETAELQNKNKKSVWRKLFHGRRNKVHPLSGEDQKKDSCAPQALSPTAVDPCQPQDQIDEQQKKENKWGKSVWKKVLCRWKKNKIHSLSREDWPPPHHV